MYVGMCMVIIPITHEHTASNEKHISYHACPIYLLLTYPTFSFLSAIHLVFTRLTFNLSVVFSSKNYHPLPRRNSISRPRTPQVESIPLDHTAWSRCYDQIFLRFSTIFGEKIGVFLKNPCYDHNFCKN
jgi:hypothetical protein